MAVTVAMVVLGVALVGAGLWWLWGGRCGWLPTHRVQAACSAPTRAIVGFAHLVLGYHLVVWGLRLEQGPIQFPRRYWPWVVLGAAAAIAASMWLDTYDTPTGDRDGKV